MIDPLASLPWLLDGEIKLDIRLAQEQFFSYPAPISVEPIQEKYIVSFDASSESFKFDFVDPLMVKKLTEIAGY